MWKKLHLSFKFLLCFLALSGILVILWKFIEILYLNALVIVARPIWSVFQYPVQAVIQDKVLHFLYRGLGNEPLSFGVFKSDEIYLNLVMLLALFGAAKLTIKQNILRSLVYSVCILFVIHEFILFAYSYTHIWGFIETQDISIQEKLMPLISQRFSKSAANFLDTILYHWNTWGWDVVPLILWIGGTYKSVYIKELWSKLH